LVFLDLKKAFDTVCHKTLLLKFEHYGVRVIASELLASYLCNRKQFISNCEIKTDMEIVQYRVLQGLN